MKKFKIKSGDTVKVIAGENKGSEGKVLQILKDKDRVVVEGVNMVSKHTKPSATNPQGGIVKKEASLHISNVALVENGVLKSFYHNTATASYFGVAPTAHGARGAKSPLGVSGSTRVISAGDISDKEIHSGEYFEIHELSGLHSGANAISGDFSFGASGYLVKDGVKVKPVRGVTISGNFHKMLLEIGQIGDTIHATSDKSFFAPALRFENMSIAGA